VATILPQTPPRRSLLSEARFALPRLRMPALVLAVLLVGLAAAYGVRAWTGRGEATGAAAPDLPGGLQRALPVAVALPASGGQPGFTISLPAAPRILQAASERDETMLSAPLGETGLLPLLMVVRFPDADSPRASLATLAPAGAGTTVGPSRATVVAGRPALTADLRLGNERVVHEYRFEVGGVVYGVGILRTPDDAAGYDTALAAMATLTFYE
jgi:hypothetical protein